MVFGSTVLEVAIGMIFVYLLMSLLCSAFNELINAALRLRARDLEDGIRRLLDDEQERKSLRDKLSSWFGQPSAPAEGKLSERLFHHPLIEPFSQKGRPSYIPARTFSLALWNLATAAAKKADADKQKQGGTPPPQNPAPAPPNADADNPARPAGSDAAVAAGVTKDLERLRETIITLDKKDLPDKLKQSLVTLIDEADNDFDKARANVENWYNDAMDRVSGGFRRRAQYILIALGFAVAAAMNVDSFNIVKVLWNSDDLRKAVVDAAEVYAKTPPTTTKAAGGANAPGGGANSNSGRETNANVNANAKTNTNTNAGRRANANANTNTNANANTDANANANTNSGTGPNANGSAGATPTGGGGSPDAKADFEAAQKKIKDIQKELNGLGLPIGWDCGWRDVPVASGNNPDSNANSNSGGGTNANASVSPTHAPKTERKWKCENIEDNPRGAPHGFLPWLLKLAGIFLTAMAVSQGAPFWFDLLNKFIVIRSTVKPREKSQPEGTKDKSAKGDDKGDGS
jgi:hypothetical protein